MIEYPKYIKLCRAADGKCFVGKVVSVLTGHGRTKIIVDFIGLGSMTTWWPAGSFCKCLACKEIKEATKKEYDNEYRVALVMKS